MSSRLLAPIYRPGQVEDPAAGWSGFGACGQVQCILRRAAEHHPGLEAGCDRFAAVCGGQEAGEGRLPGRFRGSAHTGDGRGGRLVLDPGRNLRGLRLRHQDPGPLHASELLPGLYRGYCVAGKPGVRILLICNKLSLNGWWFLVLFLRGWSGVPSIGTNMRLW